MLLNVKKNVEDQLKIKLNSKRIDILMKNVAQWQKGKIIYPNELKSKLVLSFEEIYDILDIFEDLGVLRYAFQIYCCQCNKFLDFKILESLSLFPSDCYCDENHKLSPTKDVILLYKVIEDGN